MKQPLANGFQPHYRPIPSGLCCQNFMHIKTGAYIVVYVDLMGLTAQFAYLAARIMIYCCTPWTFTLAVAALFQLCVCYSLFHGVKYHKPTLLVLYLIAGVLLRALVALFALCILSFESFFHSAARSVENLIPLSEESMDSETCLSRLVPLAVLLVVLALNGAVVYKCLVFLRDVRLHLTHTQTDYVSRQNAGLIPYDNNGHVPETLYRNGEKQARCQFHRAGKDGLADHNGQVVVCELDDNAPTNV